MTKGHLVTHNTLFCNGLLRSFLEAGHFAGLIDAERTTTISWLETLMREHADDPGFRAARPSAFEDAVESVRSFAYEIAEAREKGEIDERASGIVVVDSITKLIPKNILKEIQKENASSVDGMGGRAAQIKAANYSAWLHELTALCNDAGITAVLVTREREVKTAMGMSVFEPIGGSALTYDSSLLLRITHSWIKERESQGDGDSPPVLGERHRVQIAKTKIAGKSEKKPSAYFHTSNGRLVPEGFDPARDLLELGEEFGVVERAGAWFSFAGERLGQGANNAVKALYENKDRLAALDVAVRAKFGEREPQETGEVEE